MKILIYSMPEFFDVVDMVLGFSSIEFDASKIIPQLAPLELMHPPIYYEVCDSLGEL